jgi:hypothetical protein
MEGWYSWKNVRPEWESNAWPPDPEAETLPLDQPVGQFATVMKMNDIVINQ